MMFVTAHCETRVLRRLCDIVTLDEIRVAVAQVGAPKVGETWVFVKRLPGHVFIPCSTQDGAVNGDTVWAVIKRRDMRDDGAVVTIMVRRWGQSVKADHVVGV